MKTKVMLAYETDEQFSKVLKAHKLDRWGDSTKWPADVRAAFEAKKAADKAAFNPEVTMKSEEEEDCDCEECLAWSRGER
jgi:hypothetical protein